MTRPLRPVTPADLLNIAAARDLIRQARALLRDAGAHRAAAYAACCEKSVSGALNHAHRALPEELK